MNFSKTLILTSIIASLALVGCGDSNSSSDNDDNKSEPKQERFAKMPMGDQFVMQDMMTNLEWVEGNGRKAGVDSGCNPVGAGNDTEAIKSIAKQFCSDLNFAGHEDWRVATPAEHQTFITEMAKEGKIPFYANPTCPRLVGVEANGTTKSINTHNTNPIGAMTPWEKLPLTGNNAGVKCVRTFSAMMP